MKTGSWEIPKLMSTKEKQGQWHYVFCLTANSCPTNICAPLSPKSAWQWQDSLHSSDSMDSITEKLVCIGLCYPWDMKKQPGGRQTCAHADRYMDVDDSCSWITLLLFVCLFFGGNPQGLQAEQGDVRRWNISSLWRASFINSSQHPSQLLIPAPHGWDLVGSESAFAQSPVCVTKAEKTSSCLLAKESLFCWVCE